ncbi:hypothetical protein UC8_34970 [Roseimaritima ulvae]|uniref:SNF2 N-terminal domain-containing protein n=1 Tax=Roseimaritima ulvae TaxID=980254 RepID=A0A5B9QVS5_9BACT|nr:hypothetical protein UC8_34970 [Roseimaritima ulvae]
MVSPFILRRTKTQVLPELPSRTEVELRVQWSDEEAAFYEALRHRAIERLADVEDGKSQHLQVLAEITRLRRACCHPKLVVEDQASDRAHRLGQQRPVTIYRMITRNSIEERILELHASKRDLADSLLEGTDHSGKLTTDELLKLLRG